MLIGPRPAAPPPAAAALSAGAPAVFPGAVAVVPAAGEAVADGVAVAAPAGAPTGGFCDGQGGSSACATGMMLPNDAITIQNGIERSMKGSIIMARRTHAGRIPPNSGMLDTDARRALIHDWLSRELHLPQVRIEVASSDASFRRYFRAWSGASTYIVMDAPPEEEDVRPYLKVSRLLEELGVHVPHVHEADSARGLLLLEDLGTALYLERLTAGDDPGPLYRDALAALAVIQLRGVEASAALPPYDRTPLAA